MCLAAFVVKYVLFFANVVFSLAGLGLVGVGIAVLVQFSDLVELVPVAINSIPIAVIVVGAIVFFIALFGCCGAIKESRCLLIVYSVCMMILAAVKIYLAVVIFQSLSDIYNVVEDWIRDAFDNANLREAFHVVEAAFQCCGVSGPGSYDGVYPALPPTCCAAPADVGGVSTCAAADAYGGCANIVANWFNVFGDAVAIVFITVIVVEVVLILMSINGACRHKKIKNHRSFVITEVMDSFQENYTLRLDHVKSNKLFPKYINGKCTRNVIGPHTIAALPNKIDASLNLEDPALYTGQCFRRTSATLPADSGADLLVVERLAGWKSDQVAEGYIEDSVQNKQDVTKNISLKTDNTPMPRTMTVTVINSPNMSNVTYNFPCQSLLTNPKHGSSLELPVFFTPKSKLSALPVSHDVSVLNLQPSAMSPETPLTSAVNVRENQQPTTTTNILSSHTITGSSFFTQQINIGGSNYTITISIINCANMTNVAFNFPCASLLPTDNSAMPFINTHNAPHQQSQPPPTTTDINGPLSTITVTIVNCPNMTNVRFNFLCGISSNTLNGSSPFKQKSNTLGSTISVTLVNRPNLTNETFNYRCGLSKTYLNN